MSRVRKYRWQASFDSSLIAEGGQGGGEGGWGGRINEGTSRVGVNNKKLCHLKYAAVSYLEGDGRC